MLQVIFSGIKAMSGSDMLPLSQCYRIPLEIFALSLFMLLMLSKLVLSHHCSRTGPESRKLCKENRHGQKLDSDPTEGKHTLGF